MVLKWTACRAAAFFNSASDVSQENYRNSCIYIKSFDPMKTAGGNYTVNNVFNSFRVLMHISLIHFLINLLLLRCLLINLLRQNCVINIVPHLALELRHYWSNRIVKKNLFWLYLGWNTKGVYTLGFLNIKCVLRNLFLKNCF